MPLVSSVVDHCGSDGCMELGFFGSRLCNASLTGADCYGENIVGEKREAGRDHFSYMKLLAGICILVAFVQGGGDSPFVRLKHHGLRDRTSGFLFMNQALLKVRLLLYLITMTSSLESEVISDRDAFNLKLT